MTGRGYRFIAPVISPAKEHTTETPKPESSVVSQVLQGFVSQPNNGSHSRKMAMLEQEQEPREGQLLDSETARGHQHRRVRTWLLVGLASLAFVCVLSLLAFWGWRASHVPAASQPKIQFSDLSDHLFSQPVTEELLVRISA